MTGKTLCVAGGLVVRPDGSVAERDVLVDGEAGEIIDVGPDLAGSAEETLDATDSVVVPGLVNAHTHAAMTLLRGYADDKPLEKWLQEDIWPAEAALDPADVRAGTDLALLEMIRSGTTAFGDMYFHVGEVVDAVVEAGLRARVGHGIVTVGKDVETAHDDVEEGLDVAREFDGAADGRIRTAVMPHSLTTVSAEAFEACVATAAEEGVPLHLHANETRDEVDPIVDEHGVAPLEYADGLGVLDEGTFLAHGVHVSETEIGLLADRGASVVHCPASNMKLASGMAPVQEYRDAGVTVALGTDGAASNNDLDLFDEMRDAAMIGKLAAGRADAVAAPDVVEMATAGGADALGLPGGRLAPGEAADLAVVSLDAPHLTPVHDVVSHLVYAARGSDVRHTLCDGQVLMRDREVLTMDEAQVKQEARERAAAMRERVD
jgi:5-methylthioadenosine/S-adenosylhomocysteine deaminase